MSVLLEVPHVDAELPCKQIFPQSCKQKSLDTFSFLLRKSFNLLALLYPELRTRVTEALGT